MDLTSVRSRAQGRSNQAWLTHQNHTPQPVTTEEEKGVIATTTGLFCVYVSGWMKRTSEETENIRIHLMDEVIKTKMTWTYK